MGKIALILKNHIHFLFLLSFYILWSLTLGQYDKLIPFLDNFPEAVDFIHESPFWKLFLPMKVLTGSYSTTGLILFRLIEEFLESTGIALLVTNLAFLLSLYIVLYNFSSSKIIALTSCFLMAMSTHNYHIYQLSGSAILPLVSTYVIGCIFFQIRIIQTKNPYYYLGFIGSIFFLSLSYEGWLDYLVWAVLVYSLLLLYNRHHSLGLNEKQISQLLLVNLVWGLLYVFIKVNMGFGQHAGSESDLAFNYGNPIAITEDLISNLFKQLYLTIATFLPPSLIGSNTLLLYGKEWIIEQQSGYHSEFSELAYYNHVFLWRYWAGIFMAAWCLLIYKYFRLQKKFHNWMNFIFLCLLLALPFAGATHTITKFRPFNAMPFLGYHAWLNVLCLSVLLALVFTNFIKKVSSLKRKVLFLAMILYIISIALIRPIYLNDMLSQVEMGRYPLPHQIIKDFFIK